MKKLTTILGGLTLGAVSLFGGDVLAQEDWGKWKMPSVRFPSTPVRVGVPENIKKSVVCLRTTTVRQEPKYDSKGNLYFSKNFEQSFGTGFVYMNKDSTYHVITNYHVACGNLMSGSAKKVRDIVEIVDNDRDRNIKDDIILEKVVTSQAKDIAILKVQKSVIDYFNKKFKNIDIDHYQGAWGDSSKLKKGQKIVIEGFPHAKFQASTQGIVSNPKFKDVNKDHGWSPICVIYDAATNPGNSGSPAFRVTPTGIFEWEGLVHAGYNAEGMKMFIALNEFKNMAITLKEGEIKKEPVVTDEMFAKAVLNQLDKSDLKNLFTLQEQVQGRFGAMMRQSYCEAKKTIERDLEFMIFEGDFPYDTKTGVRFIDEKENNYGSFDKISVATPLYGKMEFEKKDLPQSIKSTLDGMFKYMTRVSLKTTDYKQLLAKSIKTKEDEKKIKDLIHDIRGLYKKHSPVLAEFHKNLSVFLREQYFEKQKKEAE